MVQDAQGNCAVRMDYAPYGALVPRTGQDCYANPWTSGKMFTGKERDQETGLDYFGARYMSAAQGRFTSPDPPLLAQEPSEPQSWNLYSYTANNPLTRIDPDGHNWFNVNGSWEWHEGDTYDPDGAKGKQKPIKSNYTHLLVFQQTGTNRYGAATGTLTLYDQNKVIATSSGFSGGPNSPAQSEPIPGGTFYINLARKETATSPGAVRNVEGGAQLHNHYGIEKIPATLSDAAGNAYDFRVEWGNIRAALNEPRPGMPQAYRGNFLHGKTRTGDYTHGCICERSERILNMLWILPTPRVPVWVRRP
jgi:RHS repeat-associated protein